MVAKLGRAVTFEIGDGSPLESIAGIQEKGISRAGSPIDVTSDEDGGWRVLLTDPGQNEVNISVSGVVKVDTLREMWHSADRTKIIRVTYPGGGILEGTFFMASYNEAKPFAGAITFDAEFQSSGAVEYTPASP